MNLTVIKNGEVKMRSNRCELLADGTVRMEGKPIVLRTECAARGLDPMKVLRAASPAECLARLGMNAGGVEVLTEEQFDERCRAARKAEADRIEAAIPGVNEMRTLARQAEGEADRIHREFNRMMADGNNDGVNPPRPEDRSFADRLAELRKSNPRASLYLRAERQAQGSTSYSATSGAMKGGSDAMAILLAGGSLEEAEKALAFRYQSNFD